MRIEIFIQARMGSTRLPGKTLKPILGKPMLSYQIERLRRSKKADTIVVVIPDTSENNILELYCKQEQIPCFRGSEEDVLARYYHAAMERKADAIVRITSDCPLIDAAIIDQAISIFCEGDYDYVSNTLIKTFPRGLDVEVFSTKALAYAFHHTDHQHEREHVTPYFYQHPDLFRLKNISSNMNLAHHRWTVDTPEDLELIMRIFERLYPQNPEFTTNDVLALFEIYPELYSINAHVHQKKL